MKIKKVMAVVLSIVVFSGCQTLGMKFNNEHTKAHNVEIQIDQKMNKYMKDSRLY